MFAPTATGAGIVFAVLTLACWGSWSTTLVLATKIRKMPFELFYLEWAMSFLLTGFVVGFIFGVIPGKNPAPGYEDASYVTELFGHSVGTYLYSMLGGLLWNMGNVLVCKGIHLMGQAIGVSMCAGLGLVSGSITSYIIDRKDTSLGLLLGGDAIALVGICAAGLLFYRRDQELARRTVGDTIVKDQELIQKAAPDAFVNQDVEMQPEKAHEISMARKFIVCLCGGLLLGLSQIGVNSATTGDDAMSPSANQSFFSLAVFISSCIMIPLSVAFPLEGHTADTTFWEIVGKLRDVSAAEHCLAILGGFLMCMGFFLLNLGNATQLGPAPTASIGRSTPLVCILWGTFFFKEFAGTSFRVWGIIPVIVLLFLAAIVCEAKA